MPDYRLPNGLRVFSLAKIDTDMVYQEIFVEDVYRQHGVTLRDGNCIFDVGANTGLFEIFLDQVCASATVYAFEPIPAVFDVLRRNVSLCSHLDVRLHNLGLSRQAGQAEFTFFPHLSCASTMYPDDSREEAERTRQYILGQFDQLPQRWLSWLLRCCLPPFRRWIADQVRRYYRRGQRIVCPLDTLSGVIRQAGVARIDLLKLDAERSELDVLAGIESSDWPKIRQVVVEVHNGDEAADQVRRLLSIQGLQVITDRNPHFPNIQMLYAVRPTL
jgi:FkbM family methyltransferase